MRKMKTSRSIKTARPEASLWKSPSQREEERQEKRAAVLSIAAEMFLKHGSHRVSMNEIADQLSITKPALYNYFSSKDEILVECFRASNRVIVAQLDIIEHAGAEGLGQLREFIQSYARHITVEHGSVMIRLEDRELPNDLSKEVRRYKRGIDTRVRAMIARGIKDGSIVVCDIKLTTFAIMGALNWIGQWYRSDGTNDANQIGREFAIRLTTGLAAGSPTRARD
jgi:AcrR family transcriptional regulator